MGDHREVAEFDRRATEPGTSSDRCPPESSRAVDPARPRVGSPRTDAPTSRPDGGGTPTDTDTEAETPTEGSREKTVKIGDVVAGDRLSMVVRGVEETKQLGEFQEADSGNVYRVVRLAVKNTTRDEFAEFSGFLQTTLKDGDEYNYSRTIAGTGQALTGGQLAPGEVERGDVVYEVPEDASGLTLQFDFQAFSFFDFERVVVDLSEEADSIADLSQSLKVDVRTIGEAVSYADTSVVVNSVQFTDQIGSYADADRGNEFAIVDITTTNESDEEKRISTLLQMLAKDGAGNSYPISITGLSQLDRAYEESTPLAPGERRRGKLAYEVPADTSTLYWIFEFTLWNEGDKTFWQLR